MKNTDIMLGIDISKREIKANIQDELKCDYGFIKHLIKWGYIRKLQNIYFKTNDPEEIKETMDEIYQMYKDYCDAWKLDYEADNRLNKEYLCR